MAYIVVVCAAPDKQMILVWRVGDYKKSNKSYCRKRHIYHHFIWKHFSADENMICACWVRPNHAQIFPTMYYSDGLGPNCMSLDRSWALKVSLGLGSGFSPSLNAGPWALTGLEIVLSTAVKKAQIFRPLPKFWALGLVILVPFCKSWALGLKKTQVGLRSGPITNVQQPENNRVTEKKER